VKLKIFLFCFQRPKRDFTYEQRLNLMCTIIGTIVALGVTIMRKALENVTCHLVTVLSAKILP
jgi:hypothetical protein